MNAFQTNTWSGGIDRDIDVTYLKDNLYRDAFNIRLVTNDDSSTGAISNVDGWKYIEDITNTGETIIGGIVISNYFIMITKDANGTNTIYRITIKNGIVTKFVVLKADLNLDNTSHELSIVGNDEGNDIVKIYFTNNIDSIRVVNVMDDKYSPTVVNNPNLDSNGKLIQPGVLDIIPNSVLAKADVKVQYGGSLLSGVNLYAYQLFNKNGTESSISPLSDPMYIHDTKVDISTRISDYKGSKKETKCNKSCIVEFPIDETKGYDYIRIIRVHYNDNNALPTISVVNEFSINNQLSFVKAIDSGSTLNVLTYDQFAQMYKVQFIAATLEKMNNRLFAANIKDATWDIDYDTRAYSCDETGKLILTGSVANLDVDVDLSTMDKAARDAIYDSISKEHDCVNPSLYLDEDSADYYKYSRNIGKFSILTNSQGTTKKYQHGGEGKNVNYLFSTIGVRERTIKNEINGTRQFDCVEFDNQLTYLNSTTVPIISGGVNLFVGGPFEASRSVSFVSGLEHLPLSQTTLIDVYLNSFKSYQRDEIYRFGVVFYNDKNIASPVHWISDIRMPGYDLEEYMPFRKETITRTDTVGGILKDYVTTYLVSSALGLKFQFDNLPSEVLALEIVRCKRTQSDKTILDNVVISRLSNKGFESKFGFGGELTGETDLRPYSFLTSYAKDIYFVKDLSTDPTNILTPSSVASKLLKVKPNYLLLVSPLISLSGDNVEKLFKNTKIFPRYILQNNTYNDSIKRLPDPNEPNPLYAFTFALHTKDTRNNVFNWSVLLDGTGLIILRGRFNNVTNGFKIDNGIIGLNLFGNDFGYTASILKNYNPIKYTFAEKSYDIEAIKYPKMVTYKDVIDLKSFYVGIGDKQYLNVASNNFESGTNQEASDGYSIGQSGPCAVVKLTSDFKFIERGYDVYPSDVIIASIKTNNIPYSGQSYSARSNSTYITTGAYYPVDQYHKVQNGITFGGDMFLSMYDHPQLMVYLTPVDTENTNAKAYFGAYIPMESSVNCSLMFGDAFHTYVSNDGFTASCFPQVDPVAMGSYHVQDNKFFEYNDAYSVEQTAKVYVPKYKYDITGKLSNNRIVTSQVKTNGEITDSWTTFLHANYLDVDTSYGLITNLKNFGNRLLFWQDDAFGVASVNDRSLITDSTGAQLVLGTGDVLARYDYMSTSNGNSTINDKSLIQTVGRLYWMDLNKNELCKYGDTIEPISKSKGFLTLLNDRKLNNSNKIKSALYNRKYNEVWFSFNDYSLIFSELNDRCISRFSHTSDYPIMFSNELYSISNNKLYKLNEAMSTTNDLDYKSSITYVVNKDYGTPKVFDNVNFSGWFSNTFLSTITNIKFDTKHQTAQPLKPVIYPGQVAQYKYAIDYRENTYRYAIGRNEKINNNKDRMRGNDLTCTIEFDTKNNNEFKIPFINTNYRYTLL